MWTDNKGQDMKEELKKYLKENAKDEMWYGSDQEFWMNIIDSFFESYQPERSKREDLKLIYKEPDFEKMKMENPILYEKYLKVKEALGCGALNSMET